MSKHIKVDGQLLQVNKKFKDLKQKQQSTIHGWLYEAYKKQVAQNLTDSEALSEVFEKIDEAGIWIPEHEVISAYRAKKTKYRKRMEATNMSDGFKFDYNAAANYWVHKDAHSQKMDRQQLAERINKFIEEHNTCTLGTASEGHVRCTPIEYNYDVDKGKQPDNYYSYDEFLYLLENGKWYSADHKYELFVQDCSWSEAQKLCLEKGGYLATVTCTDEAKVISELIKKEGYTDKAFFVGYRSCEWVGDTFCSFRWINKDGSYREVMPSMYDFWDYHSPGYDYTKNEWSFEAGEQEVGLAKYFEETGMIYIFDAPDSILNVSPEYAGKLGFVCEYD